MVGDICTAQITSGSKPEVQPLYHGTFKYLCDFSASQFYLPLKVLYPNLLADTMSLSIKMVRLARFERATRTLWCQR